MRDKAILWAHGASVGEVKCLEPIVSSLIDEGYCEMVLFSYTSPDGHREISAFSNSHPQKILAYPLHCTKVAFLRSILSQGQLRLCVVAENDLWPQITWIADELHAPVLVVDAHFQPSHSSLLTRIRSLWYRRLVSRCTTVCVGTEEDYRNIARFWTPRSLVLTGPGKAINSLRHGAKKASIRREYRQLFQLDEGTPVLVMGNLVPDEALLSAAVASTFLRSHAKSFVMMAPRHTRKLKSMRRFESALRERQLSYSCLSSHIGNQLADAMSCSDIVLVDSMGHLPDLYAMADVAVVGGSFVDGRGHNFLEPIGMKVPVLCGPATGNWRGLSRQFLDNNAILQVDKQALSKTIDEILANRKKAEDTCERAHMILRNLAAKAAASIEVAQTLASGKHEPR